MIDNKQTNTLLRSILPASSVGNTQKYYMFLVLTTDGAGSYRDDPLHFEMILARAGEFLIISEARPR